ncbi:MAG: hypothetical protein WC775_00215 [Patescibacteria group bacterium]
MRNLFFSDQVKKLAPLLIIQVALVAVVIMTGLNEKRLSSSSKASGVDCPPYSESQGTWCDYRHTTDENNRDAPVLNPNYLDTYNDCWDKCVKLDTTQCNGVCHYGSATVCVQEGVWAANATQCSYICNWACCGGKPKISACTGGPVEPIATRAPQQPTTPPAQPTQPPYVPPTQPPYVPPVQPTTPPRITIVQPSTPPPTSIPQGNIDFKQLDQYANQPTQSVAPQQNTGDFLSGTSDFVNGVGSRIAFEANLNSKRLWYLLQGIWYTVSKPFLKP